MFGDDLLVAPVTEQSVAVWDVYLPAEEGTSWVWLWDEQVNESDECPSLPLKVYH